MPHISAKVDDTIKQAITLRRTRDGGRKVLSESDVVRELLGLALQGGGVPAPVVPPGMVALSLVVPAEMVDRLTNGYPALGDPAKVPMAAVSALALQLEGIVSPYPREVIEDWRATIEAGEALDNVSARCLFEFHDNVARMPPAEPPAPAPVAQVVPFRGAGSR